MIIYIHFQGDNSLKIVFLALESVFSFSCVLFSMADVKRQHIIPLFSLRIENNDLFCTNVLHMVGV